VSQTKLFEAFQIPQAAAFLYGILAAGEAAGLGHMSARTFRHSYRMWIDAIGR
jgi:hypothetical protein